MMGPGDTSGSGVISDVHIPHCQDTWSQSCVVWRRVHGGTDQG